MKKFHIDNKFKLKAAKQAYQLVLKIGLVSGINMKQILKA